MKRKDFKWKEGKNVEKLRRVWTGRERTDWKDIGKGKKMERWKGGKRKRKVCQRGDGQGQKNDEIAGRKEGNTQIMESDTGRQEKRRGGGSRR